MTVTQSLRLLLLTPAALLGAAITEATTMIQPSETHPTYWQYDGHTTLLLGGSVEDNLFQISGLEAHLDTLVACGGNYVRCSMSARDEGNVWPFARHPGRGGYDLERPEGPYWKRFENFIRQTRERGIIVQIEVFDRFDFARDPWRDNPFNPANNLNYDEASSGLKTEYIQHPGARENPFFRTVPALEDNALLRRYQEKFVDRMLQVTLDQPHVLYCISNETNESPEWGRYWADYIRAKATAGGHRVFITEMWDARDLDSAQHRNTWMHPETYDFVEISQVNHQTGAAHWAQHMAFRKMLAATGQPRPVNTVKTYGANSGHYGTTRDGQERFWRSLLAGVAAVRFHRPASGLGLEPIAQANIRAARLFADKLDIFRCTPDAARLLGVSANEAFCSADPGRAYGLYFPDGGDVVLQSPVTPPDATVKIEWLDIRAGEWLPAQDAVFDAASQLRLVTPREEGYWACVVTVAPDSSIRSTAQ